MIDKNIVYILLLIALVIFLYIVYRKNFKSLRTSSVALVTGGVKTGKSLCTTYLAQKDYRSRWLKWWILTHIFKKKIEEPLFYTNCYQSFGFIWRKLNKNVVFIALNQLMRDYRFNYKSVIYIQEASLLADNMDYNNVIRNIELSLFNKLIAHETRGGAIYYDTQSVLDVHYSIKRVCSTYWFIQKSINLWLFRVLYVREMINQENGTNNFVDDVDTTTRKVLIFRWWYKHYDRYEYSYLTDDLEPHQEPYKHHNGLISFNDKYVKLGDKRKKGDNV